MNEYRIGHLEVDSPFGNAGGVVKHVEDVEKMAHTGVGWIEAGSYTLEPRAGNGANGEVVYYHNPESGETYNSLGMPNKGMDVVEAEIPAMVEAAHAFDKPLVVNVAPVTEDPAKESVELVTRAYEAGADAVLLNAGCPNVVSPDGGRHELLSRNERALDNTVSALLPVVEKFNKIFVRISPVESEQDAMIIAEVLDFSRSVSAIYTPNTWPGCRPVDGGGEPILEVPGGMGGMSGPATAETARQQTEWIALNSLLSVVSSGGINDGQELSRRLRSPLARTSGHLATAGAGTTFFYESGDWEHDVDKLLWEFQDAQSS
jgi:dihydroorotate dehydrogenase